MSSLTKRKVLSVPVEVSDTFSSECVFALDQSVPSNSSFEIDTNWCRAKLNPTRTATHVSVKLEPRELNQLGRFGELRSNIELSSSVLHGLFEVNCIRDSSCLEVDPRIINVNPENQFEFVIEMAAEH